MNKSDKQNYKTYKKIIKCGLTMCVAIIVMMSASMNVSAEQAEGMESVLVVEESINNNTVEEDSSGGSSEVEPEKDLGSEVEPEESETKPEDVTGEGETEEGGTEEGETEEGETEEGGTEEGETEEGGTEEGETEEGGTEEGGTEEGGTEEGETEEGGTEEGGTEEGGTEEGETEEGGTEEGETEEGGTEEGETEEGGTEEGETEEGGTDEGEPESDGTSGDNQEMVEVIPLPNIVMVEMLDTRTALETQCEDLGLICNGTEITGYVAGKIGEILEIPEGITLISKMQGMPAVQVILPASLEQISSGCFMGCPNLKKVSLRSGSRLWSVAMSAFYGCPQLETIDFSNSDFTQGPSGNIIVGSPFGGCPNLKQVFFSPTALTALKAQGGRPFDAFTKFAQFTLKADSTVSSEADLCTFWDNKIVDMAALGLNLGNVSKAAVIFNGSEIDITERLQTQNIAESYAAENLENQTPEQLWTSCFTDSMAKTAAGLVNVSSGGSSAEGLHYSSFAEFYKNILKKGNINDIEVDVQNKITSVFSNVFEALVTKTQAIPKTVRELSIDRITVLKT